MANTVWMYLTEDIFVELEDYYVDKENDLRAEIFTHVKQLCKEAKVTKLQKNLQHKVKAENEDGRRHNIVKTTKWDDINWNDYKIKSNSEWRPDDMEDMKAYKLRVGDNTMKLLQLFAQIHYARIDLYNKSLLEHEKAERLSLPTCFEEIIHNNLRLPLLEIINRNTEKIMQEEFDEIYRNEKPKLSGSRKK